MKVFSFYKILKDNLKLNCQFNENHSVVATGHFMIDGADLKGKGMVLGSIESVASSKFQSIEEIDYWAFGHVHHPQDIGGNNNMRYSGSPFALTFNEDYKHSVSIVNIDNHNVNVKIKEIEPLIPLIDFPNKPKCYNEAYSLDDVISRIDEVIDKQCYVRLHAKSEMPFTDVENAKIIDLFENGKALFCGIQVYLPESKDNMTEKAILTIEEFKSISPYELGCSIYKKKNNVEMPDEMKLLFKGVCDDIMKL